MGSLRWTIQAIRHERDEEMLVQAGVDRKGLDPEFDGRLALHSTDLHWN